MNSSEVQILLGRAYSHSTRTMKCEHASVCCVRECRSAGVRVSGFWLSALWHCVLFPCSLCHTPNKLANTVYGCVSRTPKATTVNVCAVMKTGFQLRNGGEYAGINSINFSGVICVCASVSLCTFSSFACDNIWHPKIENVLAWPPSPPTRTMYTFPMMLKNFARLCHMEIVRLRRNGAQE